MYSKEGPFFPELVLWGLKCPAVRALAAPGHQKQPTVGQRACWCWEQEGRATGRKTGAQGAQGKLEEHAML